MLSYLDRLELVRKFMADNIPPVPHASKGVLTLAQSYSKEAQRIVYDVAPI